MHETKFIGVMKHRNRLSLLNDSDSVDTKTDKFIKVTTGKELYFVSMPNY